ncbi:hypothetical protein EYZ11_005180 [Aspergillus tanneri]|uniref:Uncharacterized protein n=1 Tax=Aspergillus tanneri TaxID=1220188 RepID=A0A4S3JJ57_9EURO|nr:hypothetical protein EYZ11_005180 [Aspergillus tanneri]
MALLLAPSDDVGPVVVR